MVGGALRMGSLQAPRLMVAVGGAVLSKSFPALIQELQVEVEVEVVSILVMHQAVASAVEV